MCPKLCELKSNSMGSAIGVNFPNGSPTNKTSIEYFAFKVLQSEYERSKSLSTGETEDSGMVIPTEEPYYFQRMVLLYQEALQEAKKPLQECRSPSVILYKYDTMSEAERKEYHDAVLNAALTKEKAVAKKSAANNKLQDYSQSFGGTAADTKNEKEAAAILRGETAADNEEEEQQSLYPYLIPPNIEHSYDQQQLRRYGKWGRFLGCTGCYLYIHYLTKEVVSLRPDEYEEEVTITTNTNDIPEAQKDPANGIQCIDLENLQSEIDKIIQETKKTPLLIDPSQSGAVRAFYSYKGQLEDVSSLTIPFGKSGVKKEDIIERCRAKLVCALKTGATFALYMGDVRIEHADFKTKLCKKEVFPKEVFINAGAKLLQPEYDPRYRAIYREADLEAGQAVTREGFRSVVITTLDPYEYEAALCDCIPLGYMHPLYVNPCD